MKLGYFGVMALIFVFFAAFSIGQSYYEQDYEEGIQRDIYNFTDTTLSYDDIKANQNNTNETIYIASSRLSKVIDSFTNFVLVTSFEGMKFGVEYGYEHPEINYRLIMEKLVGLFTWIVYLMIAALCAKLLIPLFVIIYITGELIHKLVVKIKKKKA